MTRLLYLVSHPIQYQAPLLRKLAQEPGISLQVLFENVDTASAYYDPGFSRTVSWDVPLLEGYNHESLEETTLEEQLNGCDVLWMHGWQSWTSRRALYLAKQKEIPVLMRAESWDGGIPSGSALREWLKEKYLRWVFNHCRAFLAIGSRNRLYYEKRGVEPSQIFSMPYGVDNEFFQMRAAEAKEAQRKLRRTLNLDPDQLVILVPGKLIERKHPEMALFAWRQASASFEKDGVMHKPAILFAGDGPLFSMLQSEIRPDEPAHMLGFCNQTELPPLYQLADVVVVPSEREPWGLVVNEAMACGTAVITTDQVGAGYDLIGTETAAESPEAPGIVVPFGDINALAAALAATLKHSPAMGAAAAKRVAMCDFKTQIAGLKAAITAVC